VRQVVELALTFDHRVCDGGTAGGFLRYVADCVEQPAVLLRTLSDRDRELIALKYGAEATNRAIAELTGLSESNVGTILHRVVQTLRRDW